MLAPSPQSLPLVGGLLSWGQLGEGWIPLWDSAMGMGQLLLLCALGLANLLPPLLMWLLGLLGGLQDGGNTAQPGLCWAGSAARCPGVSGQVGRLGAAT